MSMYERLTSNREDSISLKGCMEECIEHLLTNKTDTEHPGILLGDIQSSKTRGFTGVIALGFDVLPVKVKRASELITYFQSKLRSTEQEVNNIIKQMETKTTPTDNI